VAFAPNRAFKSKKGGIEMRKLKKTGGLVLCSLCAVIFISLPLQAQGGSIGTSTGHNVLYQGPIADYAASIEPFFGDGTMFKPFGAVSLNPSSPGHTEIVTSGGDFIGAIGLLTNGDDNYLGGQLHVWESWSVWNNLESAALSGTGKVNGIDFSGSNVDWMMLTINNYTVTQTPGNYNYYVLDYTITYGDGPAPVPEPSTMLLLGAGLLGLVGLNRRRRKE
jgi:hypothetical protein